MFRGLVRSDVKRPVGMTSVPWSRGKAFVWDVTVVDPLSRGRAGSPHFAVEEAEKKLAKYNEISNSGFIFQPVAFDTQDNYGPEKSTFLDELLKRVISTTSETRARSYIFQKLSILPQQHNSFCVPGTLNDDSNLEEFFLI